MNKLFTLMLGFSLGAVSFGQVVFESDLSSWTDGLPTDGWMGTKTNLDAANIIEQTMGAEHGTSMAQLINASGSHKRFTTEAVSVTELETYEVKMWIAGADGCELRSGYYDVDSDGWFYNDYIDVFAESAGEITMVSQTVTIPSGCTSAEFILSLRNTDEVVGIVLDSISIAVTAPIEPEAVTIYDIQYATEAPYISAYDDQLVVTSGIVTGVFTSGGDVDRFFIQDGEGAWNGVYVYENGTPVAIGDSVSVTGTVTEFYELTEITSVLDVTVHSSGNALPAAVEIGTGDVADEEYEGVLVKVTGAQCTNDDAGYGQFEVNDGSGARLIDDEMFAYTATAGAYYSITGVTFLSFGEVKIYPRSIEDIEVTGYSGITENTSSISLYPNPANAVVTVNVAPTATVAVYNMAGALVYSANGNVKMIDVSAFNAGVYQVVVTDNNAVSTERLIVK